jgi:hypothetical protein
MVVGILLTLQKWILITLQGLGRFLNIFISNFGFAFSFLAALLTLLDWFGIIENPVGASIISGITTVASIVV